MNTGPSPAFSMGRLVLIALTLVWIGAAVAGFVLEKPLIHVAVVLFPLGVFFLQRPQWILIFALVATQGQLLVPGLPRGLNLAYLLLAGFLVLTLARTAILKSRVEKPTKFTRFTVWAFLAVMIFTAWRRGLGLLSLGGGALGGMQYVELTIAAGLVLWSGHAVLSPRQWKVAILLMVGASFLPALAQLVFLVSGGAIQIQYLFIRPYVFGLLDSLDSATGGSGVFRFQMLSSVSANVCLAALALVPPVGWKRYVRVGLLGLALLLAGLSGFRSAMLFVAGLSLFFFVRSRGWRSLGPLVPWALGALVILALLSPFVDRLPHAIQRSLAWIPFLDISPVARMDADASTAWRLELWRFAAEEIPNYLWLGRGLTIDLADTTSYSLWSEPLAYQYAMHNYHNGPLSLLLDFGLLGLLAGAGFFLASIREARTRRATPEDAFLARVAALYEAMVIYNALAFFFISGAITSLAYAFISLAILHGLRVSVRRAEAVRSTRAAGRGPAGRQAAPAPALGTARRIPLPYIGT